VLHRLPRAALLAMAPPLRRELARLLPGLDESAASSPEPMADDSGRTRFLNGVTAALADAALGLQGIVVDDLHFADEASVDLLRHAIGQSSLRWIVASRPAEGTPAAMVLLTALREDAEAEVLPLAPLTLPQVAEFIASLDLPAWQADDIAPELLRRTGGNPLFMLETVKAMLAAGGTVGARAVLPHGTPVGALIGQRIGRLSQAAVNLARCAALATPDFSIALASQVLGLRTLDLADPWAELEAAQIFRDGAFAHDLIHEAALASVPAVVARQLHAEIAAFLEAHDGAAARVAEHWLKAGREAPAVHALVRAADEAQEALRPREALSLRDRASELAERVGLADQAYAQAELALESLLVADKQAHSLARTERLLRLATTPVQRLTARNRRLEAMVILGDYETALVEGQEAARAARAAGQPALELDAITFASQAANYLGRYALGLQLMRGVLPWALAHADARRQMEFCADIAYLLDNLGELAEGESYHRRALEMAIAEGETGRLVMVHANLAINLADRGHLQRAQQHLQAARRHALTLDESKGVSWAVEGTAFFCARDLGHHAQALELLVTVSALAQQHAQLELLMRAHEALLWMRLGQTARAQQSLSAVDEASAPPGKRARVLLQRARLAGLLAKDPAPALREALALRDALYPGLIGMLELELASCLPPAEGLGVCMRIIERLEPKGYEGLALAARVRGCALAQRSGDSAHALVLARAALAAPESITPDDLGPAQRWLNPARVLHEQGFTDEARRAAQAGRQWLLDVAQTLPDAFRSSFLDRVPVHRELMALAGRLR
jgi:tetratricopeptide (TPR) repeat protein